MSAASEDYCKTHPTTTRVARHILREQYRTTEKAFDVGTEILGPHISRGKILSRTLVTKNVQNKFLF